MNGNSADIHRHGDRKSPSKDSIERNRKRIEKSERKISTQQYPDFKPNRLDFCDTVFYNVGYFVHDPITEYAGDTLYQKTSTKNGRQSYFELIAKLPKTWATWCPAKTTVDRQAEEEDKSELMNEWTISYDAQEKKTST